MRISLMFPTYALFSFLSVCFPAARVYLEPWLDVFQAWALANFFLLLCDFVSQSEQEREMFFANLSVGKMAGTPSDAKVGWYKVCTTVTHCNQCFPWVHCCAFNLPVPDANK